MNNAIESILVKSIENMNARAYHGKLSSYNEIHVYSDLVRALALLRISRFMESRCPIDPEEVVS